MSEVCKHCGRDVVFSETREWFDPKANDMLRTGAYVHADSHIMADCPRRCHPGMHDGLVATPVMVKA